MEFLGISSTTHTILNIHRMSVLMTTIKVSDTEKRELGDGREEKKGCELDFSLFIISESEKPKCKVH